MRRAHVRIAGRDVIFDDEVWSAILRRGMSESRHERMLHALLQAFCNFGYDNLTVRSLAQAADVTPRTVYNHFKGKEDAFREVIRWNHVRELRRGWEAGRWKLGDGGSAVDVLVAILDSRFAEARRNLEQSPHAAELNFEAFRRCRDIMQDSAITFQAGLAVVLDDLEKRGLLRLRRDMTSVDAAQMIADGARGCNQTIPDRRAMSLPDRYRAMCEALLYGFAERTAVVTASPEPGGKRPPPAKRAGQSGEQRQPVQIAPED